MTHNQIDSDAHRSLNRAELERVRLAATVIIDLGDEIPNALEADLRILREKTEILLMLPQGRRPLIPIQYGQIFID